MKLSKIIISLCFILLVGCNTTSSQGQRIELNMEKLAEKIRNKEDFAIVFTQSGCGDCENFEKMMNDYKSEKATIVYDVNIATQSMSTEEVVTYLKPIFPNFIKTPGLYYVENGEVNSTYWSEYDTLDEDTFTKWYQEHSIE